MSISRIERLKKELDGAIQESNFELALEVIDDLLGLDKESAMFWNSKGVILSKLNRTEEAIEAFDKALEMDPDESKVWYSKGSVLLNLNKLRHALACFYKALDIEPGYSKAREKFMFCLDEMIKIDKIKLMKVLKEEPPLLDEEMVSEQEEGMEGEGEEEPPVDPWAEGKGSRLVDDLFDDDESGDSSDLLDNDLEDDDESEDSSRPREGIRSDEDEDEDEIQEDEEEEGWGTEEEDSSVDDLFDDDESEEEEILEFTDDDEEEEEGEWPEEESEVSSDLSGSDDEEEESFSVPRKQFNCKCGSLIIIDSDRRPYKFECDNCGRTGTIVK